MNLNELFKGEFEPGDLVYVKGRKCVVMKINGKKAEVKDKETEKVFEVPTNDLCMKP